ncbi:hypothetical protein [Streptomyces echinatus]|uniref:Uncharacterized protein n=1 Tax=Streptomyces echinatus TaxID=67293 RepID=A0A7W9UP66_9ACTN|nr:hypothetical protein [Streptomyces echinatus]MBB5926028.1 hypothetical protein [Streptomyces echinatus]
MDQNHPREPTRCGDRAAVDLDLERAEHLHCDHDSHIVNGAAPWTISGDRAENPENLT